MKIDKSLKVGLHSQFNDGTNARGIANPTLDFLGNAKK